MDIVVYISLRPLITKTWLEEARGKLIAFQKENNVITNVEVSLTNILWQNNLQINEVQRKQ